MIKNLILIIVTLSFYGKGISQLCTNPGQTPVTAVLVCTSETFPVSTSQFCGQTPIPTPCTDGGTYVNRNPNFYRFGCYSAGTLGFTIVPNDPSANYNWQLFDVTNTNPVDVFTNPSLFMACNWSADPGPTGASIDGNNLAVCSNSNELFSKMPDLQTGRSYILMVSNENGSSGCQLTITGGSAIITDQNDPHLLLTEVDCDRTNIRVRLNKMMRCNTLAANGSDFTLSSGANITGAFQINCTPEGETPAILLTLDQPLPFGTYTLTMNIGSDGNSLMDICDRSIPAGETVPVIAAPAQFTPMDSIFNIKCRPGFIELVFKNPILCSSIAPDGSDFDITGPQAVTATPLTSCSNGTTTIIRLNLSPALINGTYQVRLKTGSDGNTLLNQCQVPTPANSTLNFSVDQAVSAAFTTSNGSSCNQNTVTFFHNGANNVNSWNWSFSNGTTSTLSTPTISFTPGNYTARLTVSNGTCSDTSSQTIVINEQFNADFDAPATICPGEMVQVKDRSTGTIDSWSWNFGDGQTSNIKAPPPYQYADFGFDVLFTVKLVVGNSVLGCSDTATRVIRKLQNCLLLVPSAFTPNGDGKNDFLYPLNAGKVTNLDFKVFNRMGQVVFATKDWSRKWNGKINGAIQDTGLYAWILSYTDPDTKQQVLKKGTSLLLR